LATPPVLFQSTRRMPGQFPGNALGIGPPEGECSEGAPDLLQKLLQEQFQSLNAQRGMQPQQDVDSTADHADARGFSGERFIGTSARICVIRGSK